MRIGRRHTTVLFCVAAAAPLVWLGVTWLRGLPLAPARQAFEEGRYATAAQLAEERILGGHPDDRRAMLLAARAYAKQGQWEPAEAYFAQVPLQQREDFHLRVRGLEARRLWQESAFVYEQILHRWPMDGDALQHLAAIRAQQERSQEALLLARRLTQIPSHRVVGYAMTGKLEISMANHARAAEAFLAALDLSPELKELPATEPAEVLQALAESLLLLGRATEAEPYALRARQLTAAPEPCWILGQVRQQQNDEEGARTYFEEAIARDPEFVQAFRELGRLYLMRRQPADALRYLLQARTLQPDDEATTYALAATYKQLGRDDEASQLLRAGSRDSK